MERRTILNAITKPEPKNESLLIIYEHDQLLARLRHCAQTARAEFERYRNAVNRQCRLLNVRFEDTVGVALGETDIVTKRFMFATHFTLCHDDFLSEIC